MYRKIALEIISIALIVLFLYTATNKLFKLEPFESVLSKSPLIGNNAAVIALAIPSIEIIVSACLFFSRTRRIGFYASFILMSLFTVYIAYMLLFASKLPCSCGGVLSQLTWKQHLVFNIFFMIISLMGIYLSKRTNKHSPSKPITDPVFT
jgi:hypothetical protein